MDRPRSSLFLVAVTGMLASLLVLFADPPAADACSIAPPQLEVRPRSGLGPGDALRVRGAGFHDAVWHDGANGDSVSAIAPPQPPASSVAQVPPLDSCVGLELVPQVVVLAWIGPDERPLERVMGPEFELELRVPDWAEPGWAALSANGVLAELKVGSGPPDPCPLSGDAIDARWPDHCPTPCPTSLDPAATVAQRPCPEPCDVVRPGAASHDCPEPCPTATEASGAVAYPPCPDPCPLYAHGAGDDVVSQGVPPNCPDPCAVGAATVAVWCPDPCPSPAELDPSHVTEQRWKHRWPHCPWPCDALPHGEDQAELRRWPCPWPCPRPAAGPPGDDGGAGEARFWRCPDPCHGPPVDPATGVTPDRGGPDAAIRCPSPVPVPDPIPSPASPSVPASLSVPASPSVPASLSAPASPSVPASLSAPASPSAQSPAAASPSAAPAVVAPAVTIAGDVSPLPSSPAQQAAAVAAAPPAPRIDFDGCRVDGPSPCLDVVYDRAVQTLRSILGMFRGR